MKFYAHICILVLFLAGNAFSHSFTMVKGGVQAVIVLPATEPECVRLAVQDLVSDVEKITGKKLSIQSGDRGNEPKIVIGTVGNSDKQLSKYEPKLADLKGKWESYHVKSKGKDLVISGSDERATMFGIYHFIEKYLGIDPLYFWSDKLPEKKAELIWNNIDIIQKTPSFQYRGWFINDEDLLTEWYESGGKRNIDYPYYGQVVNPALMSRVVESLVRLRMNLIIPASFIDIRNPAEAALVKEAAKRGVFISMHHVEPMGVSAFTFFNYWKEKDSQAAKPLFSFYSSRQKLEEVWRVYAQEWAKYPNVIWQIGLRGIADRPMWMADPGIPQSDADRGRLISEAMAVQMKIIKEVDKRANPPITTTLWAEGSTLNQAGHLKIPEKVTVVFADNSPGWKWQKDFYKTARTANSAYGVYYHHQLWGAGPHIAQGVGPAHTYQVFQEVQKMKSNAYAILNVSNIREFQLGLAASADMLCDFEGFQPQSFMKGWMGFHYGQNAAAAQKAYDLYFDSFVLHDKQQVVMLLDGQTRLFALNILKKLSQQINDPEAYKAAEEKARKATTESDWGKTSLSDASPQPRDENELLEKVVSQQKSHQNALEEALKVLPNLPAEQRTFFETNLVSQIQMMLGLEEWLANVLQARKALNEQNADMCKDYLKKAIAAFDGINEGKGLNIRSEKWAHWYRGDKKMNIANCKQQTEITYALMQLPAAPETFKEIGSVKTRSAKEIKSSSWSIGGETMDRDYTDYHSYKKYLDALGAKRIRLQGGWAKCEKVKGQYDFAWLDAVIPDAYSRGVAPWVELSYGNPIYEGGGEAKLGGRIPTSPEALEAWDKWVKAIVNRYKAQVTEWEIWNEPDLNPKNTGDEFADFYIRTAKVVRSQQPNAKFLALGIAGVPRLEFLKPFLDQIKAKNALDLIDVITYHGYAPNPDTSYPKIEEMRNFVAGYSTKIGFMQGENGAPSTPGNVTIGALRQFDWTELSQAKWDLRRMLGDHGRGIATNLFTISDIHYAAGDHMSGVNTKGILKTNPDKTIDRPKLAYKAAQHVFSIFDSELEALTSQIPTTNQENQSAFAYKQKGSGKMAVTIWCNEARPAETYTPRSSKITAAGIFKEPVYVDLISGKVYEIPETNWKKEGSAFVFSSIPVIDYPVLIAEKSLIQLTKAL